MTKAPTAELRPNQKDQDSLPEYAELDAMLNGLVEQERSVDDIAADGSSARRGQPDAEHAVHRRVQAAAGAARRQDVEPELRPGSPLSDHQSLPGPMTSVDLSHERARLVVHPVRRTPAVAGRAGNERHCWRTCGAPGACSGR